MHAIRLHLQYLKQDMSVYYDISSDDLNGDINSIEAVYNRTHSKVLILPSLYGNPADLIWAQEFCKKMIFF